ncbi:hypothetical protein IEQ34_014660 [Dendrobium chrysotoxum]|uniref:Uncharacterized protein n=1 Tax=Dendrobium chrysotoxum TaxID=161865 RepID=A0AAV7GML9_DENCH|nr:hypothetical protein IEQ34_014660 [Dendrobium chrysotoxum]
MAFPPSISLSTFSVTYKKQKAERKRKAVDIGILGREDGSFMRVRWIRKKNQASNCLFFAYVLKFVQGCLFVLSKSCNDLEFQFPVHGIAEEGSKIKPSLYRFRCT